MFLSERLRGGRVGLVLGGGPRASLSEGNHQGDKRKNGVLDETLK